MSCVNLLHVRAYGRMSQHHGDKTHAVDSFFETLSRDTGRRTVRPWPYRVVCLFLSEFVWVRFVQSTHASRVAQVIKGCVSHKTLHLLWAMYHTLQHLTPCTSTPSSLFSGPAILTTLPRSICVGLMRIYHHLQVMNPAGLLTTRWTCTSPKTLRSLNLRIYASNSCLSTSRSQLQPMTSAESIATHPESDFDGEQLRTLLASPLYLQEWGASILNGKTWCPISQDPTTGGTGKPVAVFSSQNRLKKETAASLKGTLQNSKAEFRDSKAETSTR